MTIKRTIHLLLSISLLVLVATTNLFAETTEETKHPNAIFPEMVHQFEKTLEGNEVSYDFVVKNKGDSPLKVEKVKTG